jgi:hypothetical protein
VPTKYRYWADESSEKITLWEILFMIFAAAFTLEEYTASTEHGWIIYIANVRLILS